MVLKPLLAKGAAVTTTTAHRGGAEKAPSPKFAVAPTSMPAAAREGVRIDETSKPLLTKGAAVTTTSIHQGTSEETPLREFAVAPLPVPAGSREGVHIDETPKPLLAKDARPLSGCKANPCGGMRCPSGWRTHSQCSKCVCVPAGSKHCRDINIFCVASSQCCTGRCNGNHMCAA